MGTELEYDYLSNQNVLKSIRIEELEEQNKKLVDCVKFYATVGRFSNPVAMTARILLKKLGIEIPIYDNGPVWNKDLK